MLYWKRTGAIQVVRPAVRTNPLSIVTSSCALKLAYQKTDQALCIVEARTLTVVLRRIVAYRPQSFQTIDIFFSRYKTHMKHELKL